MAGSRGARGGGGVRRPAHVVLGVHPVLAALAAGVPAEAVYLATESTEGSSREVRRVAQEQGLPIRMLPRSELDAWADGSAHQGVALAVPEYRYADLPDLVAAPAGTAPLLVALDGVTDPRNVGAVARSALAFGAGGMILPQRRSAGVTPAAWKTSAGALATLPVARVVNLTRALRTLQREGLFVVGLAGSGETALYDLDRDLLSGRLCLVAGSEDTGMSRLVAETCDVTVSIPMDARAESLNVSVAAALALSEAARVRRVSVQESAGATPS